MYAAAWSYSPCLAQQVRDAVAAAAGGGIAVATGDSTLAGACVEVVQPVAFALLARRFGHSPTLHAWLMRCIQPPGAAGGPLFVRLVTVSGRASGCLKHSRWWASQNLSSAECDGTQHATSFRGPCGLQVAPPVTGVRVFGREADNQMRSG